MNTFFRSCVCAVHETVDLYSMLSPRFVPLAPAAEAAAAIERTDAIISNELYVSCMEKERAQIATQNKSERKAENFYFLGERQEAAKKRRRERGKTED